MSRPLSEQVVVVVGASSGMGRETSLGNVTGRGVGGSTVHYAMYALRMHPSDFRTQTLDGVGHDWPIGYDDLEAYYDRVERELGIAGPVDWPWEPAGRGAHPYRPHQLNGVGEVMARGCDALGIRWRPGPIATLSAPQGERPPCVYRGWCIYGCTTDAKSSTLVTYARQAAGPRSAPTAWPSGSTSTGPGGPLA